MMRVAILLAMAGLLTGAGAPKVKLVDPLGALLKSARSLGIAFGDEA